MRSWPTFLAGSLAAGLAVSCGGSQPPPTTPEIPRPPPTVAPAEPPAPKGPDLLPAQVLAQIDDETSTPYFARRAGGGLALFSSHGHWLTRAVAADGTPKAPAPLEVATTTPEVAMAALRPVGDGYLAAWVEADARNHAIKVLALDVDGKPRGGPALVVQIPDDLSWIDVLPNAKGALVVWEVQHDDRSDIFVAPFAGGKVDGPPSLVAHDVIGWEAEATERGAAVATVAVDAAAAQPAPRPRGRGKKATRNVDEGTSVRGTKSGKVFLTEVDAQGKAGAPVTVSAEPTAQIDVTLAEVGGKYVIGWTDERNIDTSVYLAAVEPGGKVSSAPHRATAPFGEQVMVSLVAAPFAPDGARSKRALLAWEDQLRAPREGRLLRLATVGPDAQTGKERAGLVFSAAGAPEIEPDGDGFVAVTMAPVHELPEGVEAHPQLGVQGDAPMWPAFVRFAGDLSITASEPIRAEPFQANDGVPYLLRSLACNGGSCATLGLGVVTPAKGPEVPAVAAPLALLSFPTRSTPWKAPAFRAGDEAPPRASSVTALFDGDHLARVAAADLPGGGTLAAWVTFVVETIGAPAPTGKKKAKQPEPEVPTAALMVRPIGADGVPGKPVTISRKAVSEGGVALATAAVRDGQKPETALLWVARERDESQVFATKLGPGGEKLAQKGVTVVSRKKGKSQSDAADVAVAWAGEGTGAGEGWITAWADTRDGNSEIYVARLDRGLNKTVPDQRITSAPGNSVEVQLAVRGKDVIVVWSDARSDPEGGKGDIYMIRLDAATLKKTGPETRLFASAAHSRTPQITPAGKGFLVSWIEDAAGAGKSDADAGLRVAMLDEHGGPLGAPQLVHGADPQGAVTSAAITCRAKDCRGVLTATSGDATTLGAFELSPGAPAGPVKTIAALTGATQDASPVFSGPNGTSLFFADDAVSGAGRVRWMQIAWP